MLISNNVNINKLQNVIIQEMKNIGIKYRSKKSSIKHLQNCTLVFGAQLGSVALCTVQCCGNYLQIPVILSELCSLLRANVHVEGLFRKAGSQARQREIKRQLELGRIMDGHHHPVDLASIMKLYLRALPEPIINHEVQEVLLRCCLQPAGQMGDSVLRALLLLPVLHIHILHYLMEFLKFVSSRHKDNLMDSHNLAIVLTPSVMPLPSAAPTQRLDHHVAVVKYLIENASLIGNISDGLLLQIEDEEGKEDEHRKKKRRSGSLTRMLSGLRKIVGGGDRSASKPLSSDALSTPVITKSASKRKLDSIQGFSAKSRKEVLKSLPQNSLAYTPIRPHGKKEHKKLRLSLISRSTAKSLPAESQTGKETSDSSQTSYELSPSFELLPRAIDLSDSKESDYVRISKHEYEEIKSRVSAIENRLSQEFSNIDDMQDINKADEQVKQVQTAYEKTLEEAAMLNSLSSDHIARRLSKELKIRQSAENKIIRSPSARKIGNIRRRSKEFGAKLTRNKSWNVSVTSQSGANQFYPYSGLKRGRPNTVTTGLPQLQVASTVITSSYDDKVMSVKSDSAPVTSNTSNAIDLNMPNNIPHAYCTRNQSKRSSSFHVNMLPEKSNKVIGDQKPVKWKNAASFLIRKELENNLQTGRASVNKLRSQNAGMVMAKAKLFDQLTDSDSSSKQSSESRLQVPKFARKPRVNNSYDSNTNKGISSQIPKLKDIQSLQNLKRAKVQSSISHNNHTPKKSAISPDVGSGGVKTPVTTPYIKKPLKVKSPHNFRTPNVEVRRTNAPMRAVHVTPRRQSPRIGAGRGRMPNHVG